MGKLLKIFEKDELYKKQLNTISKIYNMKLDETTELVLFEILINHNFYSMVYSNLLYFNFLSNVRYTSYYIEQVYNLEYENLNNLYSILRTNSKIINKKNK